jgi:GABA permease
MSPTRRAISVRFVLVSVAAIVAADGLVVALLIKPPLLGWIGFVVVAVIVLGLAALLPIAFERTRVSARRPAQARDGDDHLLVLADPLCSEALLTEAILACRGRAVVHVVVPLRVSRLHFLTDDEDAERAKAEQTMLATVELLRERGVPATGSVGSDKPLESMTDALGEFPATGVMLATPPDSESYWLERGLLEKARRLTPLSVELVFVAASAVAKEHAAH